jgi:hypothetical protein
MMVYSGFIDPDIDLIAAGLPEKKPGRGKSKGKNETLVINLDKMTSHGINDAI